MYMYHVTTHRCLPSIIHQGLIPWYGPRSTLLDEGRAAVFLFDSDHAASDSVVNWLGDMLPENDDLVLLHVDTSFINTLPTWSTTDSWE